MVHDPSAETPRCRLQDEDSEEYGPPIVPETAVAAAIIDMTDAHLARTGGAGLSHMHSALHIIPPMKACMTISMHSRFVYCTEHTLTGFITHSGGHAGTVSAKPIVLRAEYAYCPNLTIIDTPGFILKVCFAHSSVCLRFCLPFAVWHAVPTKQVSDMLDVQARQGEGESTPDDILEMVKAQAAPPHR